jgi:hypothetical protein
MAGVTGMAEGASSRGTRSEGSIGSAITRLMLRLNGRRQTPAADAHAGHTGEGAGLLAALTADLLAAVAAWRGPGPG